MGKTALAIHGSLVVAVLALAWWIVDADLASATTRPALVATVGGGRAAVMRLDGTTRGGARPTDGRSLVGGRRDAGPGPLGDDVAVRPLLADFGPAPAEPDAPPTASELAALLDDLRDDDVRFNAQHAMWRLRALLQDEVARPAVTAALVDTLDATDLQQRYFAATALMDGGVEDPPDRLLAVAVDMMCEGRVEGSPRGIYELRRCIESPQTKSIRFLTEHVDAARDRLLPLLERTHDEEARSLGAYVLATQGRAEDTDRLAPVLLARLRDNDQRGDAVMAMNALMGLDRERVVWWLQSGHFPDEQFTRSKRLLLVALRNDGEVPWEVARRDNVVTKRVMNPVKGWSFRRYD